MKRLVDEYELDGVDVDWEEANVDPDIMAKLLRGIKKTLGPSKIVSVTIHAGLSVVSITPMSPNGPLNPTTPTTTNITTNTNRQPTPA